LEQERALRRVAEVRRLGVGRVDVAALPENRLLAIARYGMSAKAPALRDLTEPRRTATLVATIRYLEQKAIDDALDLLEVLMQTKLLARAERESAKERLRMLPRFAAASAKLAAAIQVLLEAGEATADVSVAEIWAEIERVVPRRQLAAALDAVLELAPPPDEEADEAWRAELVKRYQMIRPFSPASSPSRCWCPVGVPLTAGLEDEIAWSTWVAATCFLDSRTSPHSKRSASRAGRTRLSL
jgi:hypothetical protein